MKLRTRESGDSTVVIVDYPRLDASVAPHFKVEMLEVIGAGAQKIVLDLSNVRMVDSSGLGALVSVLKSMNGNGSISILGASHSVLSLLKLTRMDRVFSISTGVAV